MGVPNINTNPNWYNSIALAERDYTLKFEYISGDGGTAYRPYVFIHKSDGKNLEFSQGNSTKIKNYTGEIAGISFYVDKNQTFNNYKFRVYVVKGTYTKDTIPPYSPYGMGSVEINVSNENLFNEQYIQGYFVNDSGKTNTSAEGARADDYIPISDNKTVYVLFKCLKSCTLARFWLMEFDENYNAIKRTTTGIYDTSFNIGNTIKQFN